MVVSPGFRAAKATPTTGAPSVTTTPFSVSARSARACHAESEAVSRWPGWTSVQGSALTGATPKTKMSIYSPGATGPSALRVWNGTLLLLAAIRLKTQGMPPNGFELSSPPSTPITRQPWANPPTSRVCSSELSCGSQYCDDEPAADLRLRQYLNDELQ